MVETGRIFLKPGEKKSAKSLAERTGARIDIPETGETFDPRSGGFSQTGVGAFGRSFFGGSTRQVSKQNIINKQIEIQRNKLGNEKLLNLRNQSLQAIKNLRSKFNQSIRGLDRNARLKLQQNLNLSISNVEKNTTQQQSLIKSSSLENLQTKDFTISQDTFAPQKISRTDLTLGDVKPDIPSSIPRTLLKFVKGELEFQKKIDKGFKDEPKTTLGKKLKDLEQRFFSSFDVDKDKFAPTLTEQEKKNLLKQLAGGSSFITFQGRDFFLNNQNQLVSQQRFPGDIQRVVRGEEDVILGKEFNIFTPLNFFSRKFVESDVGNKFFNKLEEEQPEISNLLELIPEKRLIIEFLTFAQLGAFFEPVLSTGATAKGVPKVKVVQKQVKKGKKIKPKPKDKVSFDDFVTNIKFKQEGNKIVERNLKDKIEVVKELVKVMKKTKDPILKQKQTKFFKRALREAYGKDGANIVLRNFLEQENVFIGRSTLGKPSTLTGELAVQLPPKISGVSVATGTGSSLNQRRNKEAKTKNEKRIQQSQKPLSQRFKEAQQSLKGLPRSVGGAGLTETQLRRARGGAFLITETVTPLSIAKNINNQRVSNSLQVITLTKNMNLQRQRLFQLINQRQSLATIQKQRSKLKQSQETILKTKQKQSQQLKTLQVSLLKSKTKQVLKQQQRLRQRARLRTRVRTKQSKRKLRKLFLPKFPFPKKKKIIKKTAPFLAGGFDIFARKKGKDIKVGFKTSKLKARKFLKQKLNITLRASGFIVDKKTRKKIKPKITRGFRKSKIDPFRIVEVRRNRLSSGKERRDIQKAKRLKAPKLKSTTMLKRKRIKKRK